VMKKLGIVIGVTVVLILSLTFASAAMAQVEEICYLSGLGTVSFATSATSIIFDPATGNIYFQRTVQGETDPFNALLPVRVPITAVEWTFLDGFFAGEFFASDPQWRLPDSDCDGRGIGDGRVNDGPRELGAPLAAYCADGGIAVWDIDTESHGTLGFTATGAEVDAGLSSAASSGLPTLIGSGLGNSLYAIPEGDLVMLGPDLRESGKEYRFSFAGNRCG
jgi:hypothetical protein